MVSPLQSPHVGELGLGEPDTSSGNGSVLLSGLRCVVSRRPCYSSTGLFISFYISSLINSGLVNTAVVGSD